MKGNKEVILVTGGAGYIGSHTVKLLTQQGRKVIVLDNLVFGHRKAVKRSGAKLIEGDVGDAKLLKQLFKKYDFAGVVHFAAYAFVGESVTNPLKYYANNVSAPVVLLQVMQKYACKNFVFSSTCATYGVPQSMPITEDNPQNPINPYGRSKLMVEKILADCGAAWGLNSACLRYFNASGCATDGTIGEDHDPETHLIPRTLMAIQGKIPELEVFGADYPTPDGTCIRDYIHVEDLAQAHALAFDYLKTKNESLACNLGTGIGVSVKELIAAAEEVSGKPVPHKYVARRPGDPPSLVADPSKAKSVLGWEAQHKDIKEIVASAWAWENGPQGGRF